MSVTHWGVFFTLLTLLAAVFAASATGTLMVPVIIVVLVFQAVAIICFLLGARKTTR